MYEQIASNKRKSFLLVFFFILFVFLLAWVFEQLAGMGTGGLVLAFIIASISAFAGYYASDKIVLTISRARPATKKSSHTSIMLSRGWRLRRAFPRPAATSSRTPRRMPLPRAATRRIP